MSIIPTIAVFLAVSTLVMLAANRTRTVNRLGVDTEILYLPRILSYLGAVCTGFGVALIVGIAILGGDSTQVVLRLLFAILGMVLLVGGAYIAYGASKWCVELYAEDHYFYYTTSLGRTHAFSFADITAYQIGTGRMVFCVYGKRFSVDSFAIHFDLLVHSFETSGVTLGSELEIQKNK